MKGKGKRPVRIARIDLAKDTEGKELRGEKKGHNMSLSSPSSSSVR